jgi:uncharacterized membrane protein YgaE (UPF0421/DUF939 family)
MWRVRYRLRDPVVWTDVLQLVKTAAAAVIAWKLAVELVGSAQPFLAPWAALLTVNATVYRTLKRGAQQVGAAVLGVLLAVAAGQLVGLNAASLGVTLFAAMVAGTVRPLRAESMTAAVTALMVLLTGFSDDGGALVTRLLDTGIGITVGLLVTLVVWPPLRDRSAARQVDAIDDRTGALLSEMAQRLRDDPGEIDVEQWVDRTRDLDHDIDRAWSVVRLARESGRLNPRRHAAERVRTSDSFGDILTSLEQAVAEARSMARTIGRAGTPMTEWEPHFTDAWLELLARLGTAISDADVDGIERVRGDLERAIGALSGEEGGDDERWPVHGALLVNLRNIAEAMGDVAGVQPVRPSAPHAAQVR